MSIVSDLKAIQAQVKREGIQFTSQLTEAQRNTMRDALALYNKNGTATPKMLARMCSDSIATPVV